MSNSTRVLIVTDSPALPTGMAEMTRLIFSNLLRLYPNEYEIHQIGLFHTYAVTKPQWQIYPTETVTDRNGKVRLAPWDTYAQRTFPRIVQSLKPDIVFAFNDITQIFHLCEQPYTRSYKLVLYITIDGLPIPNLNTSALADADLIVTGSHFSRRVLLHSIAGLEPEKVTVLYSPADLDRFSPVSVSKTSELRSYLFPPGLPDNAFVLGWVGRNQWRKQVWLLYKLIHYLRTGKYLLCKQCSRSSLLDWDPIERKHLNAGDQFLERRPGYNINSCGHCESTSVELAMPFENVYLWLHMPQDEPQADWPVRWLEKQFDLHPNRDIFYTTECGHAAALPPDQMSLLYAIWDCLVYLSGGEGFGLPAWEAMCCARPVVYSNYSSHAEFLNEAKAGLPVGGILQPESGSCIWRMISDMPQAIDAVRKLYFDTAERKRLGENGRRYVERYSVDSVVGEWHVRFRRLTKLDIRASRQSGTGINHTAYKNLAGSHPIPADLA